MEVTTASDEQGIEVPAFLGLTEHQSKILVALYNETDPTFAQQIPTALPVAAEQLAVEYEKRNSVGKKLERAKAVWLDEFKLFDDMQQRAVNLLRESDMNIDKAASGLVLDEDKECTVQDLLLGSLLYGGVRHGPSNPDDKASMSPVASPNFEGAKRLLERAFDQGYSMAGVQVGSFYLQEERMAMGKNLPGLDPKKLAYQWYEKAAQKGNPMACHKLGYFLENGIGCRQAIPEAIESYAKAFEEGYPDSAHNLGLIHQGFSSVTLAHKNLSKAIEYFEKGQQWGYAPSANALGRMYLLMSKNAEVAKEAGDLFNDVDEYIVTGIDHMETAANSGDADAMFMLGMIFGSKDYGLYDMDKAQNYMELSLIRGNLEAYNYLVRILRAKMAARVALEDKNLETFNTLSASDKEKLIQQLAKEVDTSKSTGPKSCSNSTCAKKEESEPFKQCGQCGRVAYCSRECQKTHWKAGHSVLCSSATKTQQ